MGTLGKILLWIMLNCCFLTCFSEGTTDAAETLPDESQACLECHAQKGIDVLFQNKEAIAAHVDPEIFKASVHASLGCTGCHAEFSAGSHPRREFRSKEQYKIKSVLVCSKCHSEKSLKANPLHGSLLSNKSSVPLCTDCHGTHAIASVAGGKKVAGEKQYCLDCHEHVISMVMQNSETKSLKIDPSALNASAHARLSCFDCHFGFSSAAHPKRSFKSIREFSIASADSCRRCHFDKYTKSLDSSHYDKLSQGNLNAPVCTDCHGAHAIARAKISKVQVAQTCRQCHRDIYTTYSLSVHGKSLLNQQNTDVPVCVDCHTEHSIQNPKALSYRENLPEMCGQCHANKDLMKKYGLYSGVINSYLEDFHGVTLKFYRQQKTTSNAPERRAIATCIDCHGVHNISKTKGADTNLVKARLVKQCQQCHEGATENFPDAWLSHYEPTLMNASLVYLIKTGYSIFIPFMLIGLVLQILFHVWRYLIHK